MANMEPYSVQIISDLHLEMQPHGYEDYKFPVTAPHLALLGDIGWTSHDKLYDFLETQLMRYKTVFYLLGNHEAYKSSFEASRSRVEEFSDAMQRKREIVPQLGEFVFLDRARVDVSPTLTILGCTLYSRILESQMPKIATALNDFNHINSRKWTIWTHNEAFQEELAWLNHEIATIARDAPHRRIAVFTHYGPTVCREASDPKLWNSPVSSAFVTDLSKEKCWTIGNVTFWGFGHTHWNCDFIQDGIRVATNQRGYFMHPSAAYDAGKVFTL